MNESPSELILEIENNKPAAIASDGNIDAIAFNMEFLRAHNPAVAARAAELYEAASVIKPTDEVIATDAEMAEIQQAFQDLLRKFGK